MAPLRHHPHPWDLSPGEAVRLQEALRRHVVARPLRVLPRSIAGVDVGFPQGRGTARAAVVLLDFRALSPLEEVVVETPLTFPYVPGLLSFREAPAILKALDALDTCPDVVMVDGHGLAHPRRFGLACHLGVILDLPTIGCAKSILVGSHGLVDEEVGSTADLLDGEEVIGAAVRTRRGVKPVYVSVGHRVDLNSAVKIVLACGRGYRLPEPARMVDRLASRGRAPQRPP